MAVPESASLVTTCEGYQRDRQDLSGEVSWNEPLHRDITLMSGGVLRGYVFDELGMPQKSCNVEIFEMPSDASDEGKRGHTSTDVEGRYWFNLRHRGYYEVVAYKHGVGYGRSQPIFADAHAAIYMDPIILQELEEIEVRLVLPDGEPAARVVLLISARVKDPSGVGMTESMGGTDGDGRCVLRGLQPGEYELIAQGCVIHPNHVTTGDGPHLVTLEAHRVKIDCVDEAGDRVDARVSFRSHGSLGSGASSETHDFWVCSPGTLSITAESDWGSGALEVELAHDRWSHHFTVTLRPAAPSDG